MNSQSLCLAGVALHVTVVTDACEACAQPARSNERNTLALGPVCEVFASVWR
jgi:hypothetical protein